jgi:hypothetical protein
MLRSPIVPSMLGFALSVEQLEETPGETFRPERRVAVRLGALKKRGLIRLK